MDRVLLDNTPSRVTKHVPNVQLDTMVLDSPQPKHAMVNAKPELTEVLARHHPLAKASVVQASIPSKVRQNQIAKSALLANMDLALV